MTPRLLLPLALAFALAGCETFAEPDPADHAPVLLVFAPFEAGVPWHVEVGRTVALGDSASWAEQGVADATVTVTADDGTATALPYGEDDFGRGYYGAAPVRYEGRLPPDAPLFEDGPAPEAGRSYTLRVSAPGYSAVVARSRTPLPPRVEAEVAGGWAASNEDARLSVRLAGVPADAYVRVSFSSVGEQEGPDGVPQRWENGATFVTGAPLLREATFFDDVQRGARRREFAAFLDLDALSDRPFEVLVENPIGDEIRAEALATSEEFFLRAQSQARAQAAERNPFAEPVPAYSNVEGGAGVFAGSTRARTVVRHPG